MYQQIQNAQSWISFDWILPISRTPRSKHDLSVRFAWHHLSLLQRFANLTKTNPMEIWRVTVLEASLKERQTMRNCCLSKPLWEIASQLAKWRPQFPRCKRELGFRLSKWGYLDRLDLIQQSLVSFIPKRSSSQARCIGVWHRPRTLLIEVGAIHCTFPLVKSQMQ